MAKETEKKKYKYILQEDGKYKPVLIDDEKESKKKDKEKWPIKILV